MGPSALEIDRGILNERPLPVADAEGGKVSRGKLLIVAGSLALPGAAILAARAALRVGCGSVRVAAPRSVALAIGVAVPESLVVPLAETEAGTADEAAFHDLSAQFDACDAAVIGPGQGASNRTERLAVRFLAGCPLPTVVDATALRAWGRAGSPRGPGPRVLTPHVGEMAEATGLTADDIGDRREEVATRFAADWGAVVVLKGKRTLIAGDGLYRNSAGTPGLGTSGSGDLLAGVIGGLLARGADPTTAAVWGVHLHALAGEAAAARRGDDGMIASDVVDCLPDALKRLTRPV